MSFISEFLAWPLGWLIYGIYKLFKNYFVTIFVFTLIVRAATFPFSLKSQKANAERAKLAPKLERIQKKYKNDSQKVQEMQMKLYEKEGISMTGGCLPMLIPMIVLFGVIAVIYSPLKHFARVPEKVIDASVAGIVIQVEDTKKDDKKGKTTSPSNATQETQKQSTDPNKVPSNDPNIKGVYKELELLRMMDEGNNRQDIATEISKLDDETRKNVSAEGYLKEMDNIKEDFKFFGNSLLQRPNADGYKKPNVLWIIPIISWITAMGSSIVSMYFMKKGQGDDKQPGQGCNNVLMLGIMPLFSLYITFTVPGGVGVYWISSNLIAIIQTVAMNLIYNPAKIRAEAFEEDDSRRKQKRDDRRRLAQARKREEKRVEEEKKQAKIEAQQAQQKKQTQQKEKNKQPPSQKPNNNEEKKQ